MAAASGIPRTRGGLSGLLLIVLGAWGALVPFVGPYFHYAYTPDRTWAYTTGRLWLEIAPGAAAVIGGFIVAVTRSRVAGGLGAFLAALGGAWFVVGATVTAQLVRNGSITTGLPVGATGGPTAASTREFLEGLGFFTGTGVLIVFFAALALGRFSVPGAGVAAGPEPWALHEVPADEVRHQEGYPASQEQIATRASQYPPPGSQPSPAGQVPPQHDAFGQQAGQGTSGLDSEETPTAVGQLPSSPPATDQFPPSPPATEEFPASPPATEQFPPSPPATDQFPPSPPATEQFPPSPPATEQSPASPPATEQFPPSPSAAGQFPASAPPDSGQAKF